MKDKKIEIIGCTIQLKDKQIFLSIDEARQLKGELEKMFPTPFFSAPHVPSEPFTWPTTPKPYELDPNPYTPDPNNPNRPYITWCYSTPK